MLTGADIAADEIAALRVVLTRTGPTLVDLLHTEAALVTGVTLTAERVESVVADAVATGLVAAVVDVGFAVDARVTYRKKNGWVGNVMNCFQNPFQKCPKIIC